jgi:hypothetical protein
MESGEANISWRKLEEGMSHCRLIDPNPLKALALPRGIEPLFQP